MTCSQCRTILTPGDQFCAVCGAPASGATAEAPVTRLSIAKPTAEVPAGSPAGITLAALVASPLVRRVAIVAAAAIVVLILVVALIPRGSGSPAASDDGTAGIGESSEGSSPEGADPAAAPTTEVTPAPVIPPHYSPAQGAFAPVDPGRFAIAGYEGISFLSPSGNVGCAISNDLEGNWGCAINEHGWAFESDTADDYCYGVPSCGGGIEATGSAPTHPRTAEEWSFPAATALAGGGGQIAVLQYGELVNYGNIICYAESLGITCQNAVSGHGFTIARDRNELY